MQDCQKAGAGELIGHSITESYEVLAGRADSGLVIVCDHASNGFPREYGTLGLDRGQTERHIAYDIGALGVTSRLSDLLGAPAVVTNYSRLLIDPNRGLDDPTLVMRISDGAVVPGNRELSAEEREKRVFRYYQPYHEAIDRVLDQCETSGVVPVLLSIHSFTDIWRGVARPWEAAVLWDRDGRLAVPMLEGLRQHGKGPVGDNEPYTGQLAGDCMWRHGTQRGFGHALIELRQDLIGDPRGQELWAQRLADILGGLLVDKAFRAGAGRLDCPARHTDILEE